MITYQLFPALLHTSFTRKDAPKDLPFQVESEEKRKALAENRAFSELLPAMASLNELAPALENYYLAEKDFRRIEYNAEIRQKHFIQFQQNPPTTHHYGVICFGEGGQYVYLYLNAEMAGKLRGQPYPYLCTSFIAQDVFMGIEEGYFTPNGINIERETTIYSVGMDPGGYMSFTTIALDYIRTHKTRIMKGGNRTKEVVYTL